MQGKLAKERPWVLTGEEYNKLRRSMVNLSRIAGPDQLREWKERRQREGPKQINTGRGSLEEEELDCYPLDDFNSDPSCI